MPDWKKLVHERLQKLSLPPERKQEIVNEIANHMEDVNEEKLQVGISEKEALEKAALSFPAWECLSHSIQQIELQEGTIKLSNKNSLAAGTFYRVHLICDPGLVSFGRSRTRSGSVGAFLEPGTLLPLVVHSSRPRHAGCAVPSLPAAATPK